MPRQRAEILAMLADAAPAPKSPASSGSIAPPSAASPPRREPCRPKQGRLLKLSRRRPLRSPCCRKADSLAISMGCNRPSNATY
jgi:hypothetical protein